MTETPEEIRNQSPTDPDRPPTTLRPITGPAELGLFNRFPYAFNDELADDLGQGRRRPEWLWVALRGDRLLARVGWWSRSGDGQPLLLDILDFAGGAAGTAEELLRTAMAQVVPAGGRPPEYTRLVPVGWRDDPAARRAVQERMAVLERTGARLFVERLRLEWRAGTPLPEPDPRLAFRPVRDAEDLLGLMTEVMEGTLDAHSRDDLTRMSAREGAVKHYQEELAGYSTPREWWRVATLHSGEPVGFVIPAHNAYNPIIAYIGVLPRHRGSGYVDGVLAEGTRILVEHCLAAEGVRGIRASTDLANVPMARAFERAGYEVFERQIDMVWH